MRKYTRFLFALIVFGICIVPLLSLLTPGLPITHDGQDHVARIANFYQSLSEGNILPRWAGNLNWGYGHPILMFLYPMSSYLGSLFHSIGFSLVDSVKLIFAFAYIAGFFTMYLWMKAAFGKPAGVIGAILYTFAPYRFVDLYVRGAIGEHVAFVFPPLILFFLYKLSQPRTGNYEPRTTNQELIYGIGLSISMACLILSHNAFSLMFLPIIALYALYLFFADANRSLYYIQNTIYYILLGFGLSAFFWIPALFEGKYTLRDIVTKGSALNRFVPVSMFFYSPWNYGQGNETTKFLGLPQWLGIIASLFVFWKTKDRKLRWLIGGSMVLLTGTIFIMISCSQFIWEKLMILQNFQFPWRFQMISVFLTAFLGGIAITQCLASTNQQPRTKNFLFIAFCIFSILVTAHMWKPKGYSEKPDIFYSGIYESTTDTGESSPIWSVRFMEYAPLKRIDVIGGIATVIERSRTTTEHVYTIDAKTPSQLLENTLYFPGWNIYVDGFQTEIEFQDPHHRGIMTFRIDEGVHDVRVVFQDTKIRTYAEYASLLSFGILVCMFGVSYLWKKRT